MNLGIAFQIIDDVLDLVGHPERVGKTLGTDVVNQKPTLPLIHSLSTLSGDARSEMIAELSSGRYTAESLLPRLESTGSVEYARQVARRHAQDARQFALSLGDGPHAVAMQKLALFVLQRSY